MFKKTGLLFLILLLCGFPGCSRAVSAQRQDSRLTDLSSMEAESVSIVQNIQEKETLRGDEFYIMCEEVLAANAGDIPPEDHANVEKLVRNDDYVFYQISYSEHMAQYSYRNKIYAHCLNQDEDVLIYDTSEAYQINEMMANNTHLYWVEYVSDGTKVCYRVMQYQLGNGNISCIAERDSAEFSDMCLALSERFLTWDDMHSDGQVEIVVFDIEKQKFRERNDVDNMPGSAVTLNNARLQIVEDCITYFTQDEQEQLYIQRENLSTGETDSFLLGKIAPYRRPVGCFSDSRYIGWHTEYGQGEYYFYDTAQEKLYCWDVKKDGMYAFSKFFSDGKLYFNNTEDDNVYVWDLSTGQVYRQHFADDGYWFNQYGENQFYLETSSIDVKAVLSIRTTDSGGR